MICSTHYRTALSIVGAVIMTLGTFSMLQASAPWEPQRGQLVRYHEADLDQPASATRLYKRIHTAAEKVCAPLAKGDAKLRSHLDECIDDAVTNAVTEVNRPQLDAVHSARIGGWRVASERLASPGV